MSKQTDKLIAIDEEYSSLKSALSKKQDKALQDIIAQERVKEYSVLGRGMNMADKATSLAVRGNTDIVIESPNEKELYITLGKEMLKNETRDKKSKGGKADFPDLTGDGKITQADVLKGRGVFNKGGKNKIEYKTKGLEIDFDLTPEQIKVIQNTAKGFEIDFDLTPKQIAVTKETSKRMEDAFFKKLGNILNINRTSKAEGGDMDSQMEMMLGEEEETPMLPDEQMEEDYVDYVVEETLSNQDRNYLIDALEKDDRLSEIFDQVVESATEFTGSGTVEGPGTGKSDSIPARLSDGEFVFTAKATEEIGSDNLMLMMKEAEAQADERQSVAYGGMINEEDQAIPVSTQESRAAQGNVPDVVKQSRQVEEEMLKSSPRRYYVPVSG